MAGRRCLKMSWGGGHASALELPLTRESMTRKSV